MRQTLVGHGWESGWGAGGDGYKTVEVTVGVGVWEGQANIRREEGGGLGLQNKLCTKKWPSQSFPIAIFVFSRYDHFGLGGGGGGSSYSCQPF